MLSGEPQAIPGDLDLLVAGFSCKAFDPAGILMFGRFGRKSIVETVEMPRCLSGWGEDTCLMLLSGGLMVCTC